MKALVRTKRRRVLGGTFGVVVVAAIAVGTALAYYGGSGTGSATAAAGTAPRTVTVTGAANPAAALYPGESRPVDITVTLVGPGSARVGSVSATSIDTSNEPACDPAWFSFTPPSSGFGVGTNVSAGSPLVLPGATSGASLTFIDAPVNQDACSDATITINLAASPS